MRLFGLDPERAKLVRDLFIIAVLYSVFAVLVFWSTVD